jgi:hypothetical protein
MKLFMSLYCERYHVEYRKSHGWLLETFHDPLQGLKVLLLEILDDPLEALVVLLLFLCPDIDQLAVFLVLLCLGIGLTECLDGLHGFLLLGMHGETEVGHVVLVFRKKV